MAAVEVNECRVFATAGGAKWWTTFLLAHRNTDRITVLKPSIGGDLCSVACESDGDAEWLASHMVEHGGLPKSAVRVVKTTAVARAA